jgi:hypothetical protein
MCKKLIACGLCSIRCLFDRIENTDVEGSSGHADPGNESPSSNVYRNPAKSSSRSNAMFVFVVLFVGGKPQI